MTRRSLLILALVLAPLVPSRAHADEATVRILDDAWPRDGVARAGQIGHGVGVVFSPDLSVPDNCRFYAALGFACFQSADWSAVLDDIHTYNFVHPENRIRTIVLETHGTNGNGLKLQQSYAPKADRSYISVGALQERLGPEGVRYILISACNSGRLLRPWIVRSLDPNPGDKLFLPATCGIVNASARFDERRSRVAVVTPASSHIETTLAGRIAELAPLTRRVLDYYAKQAGLSLPREFAISDLMMQMILRDPALELSTTGYVDELSRQMDPESTSERLFSSFVAELNALASRDARYLPLPPVKAPAKKALTKKAPAPRKRVPAKTPPH